MCTSAWLSGNRPGCLETGRSPNKKGAHPTKKSTEQCHSRKSNRLKEIFVIYKYKLGCGSWSGSNPHNFAGPGSIKKHGSRDYQVWDYSKLRKNIFCQRTKMSSDLYKKIIKLTLKSLIFSFYS